jgi:WD40 repeat protein
MDTTGAPQIIEHVRWNLDFTPFETRWVPQSARFVVLGQMPRATGAFRVCSLNKGEVECLATAEKAVGFKCATFGASRMEDRHIATGDYKGGLAIWDLERVHGDPIFKVDAHDKIINAIDGIGGLNVGFGAPELVTGSRDGTVRVWDPRQQEPVLSLEPMDGENPADCWTVAFGNAHNDAERCICAGYDNGDVKIFDLRTSTLRWDTNVKNGVCHVAFDRRDIAMNKLGVSTLESQIIAYDLRTYHPTEGYAGRRDKVAKSTVWGTHFLPQNRDIFATCGGNGAVHLYKYAYPEKRTIEDGDGVQKGVAGSLELVNSKEISTQPIVSFDWHQNKQGLAVFAALDQTIRVIICTKLNLY